jgi:ubiquinone/menaquinone biosynthesis C-methylase UbiE
MLRVEHAEGISMAFGRIYRNSTDRFLAILYREFIGFPTSLGDRVRAHYVMKFVSSAKNEKILDLGCGIGVYCLEMAFRGATVVGVDFSRERILRAYDATRNRSLADRVSFVRCDVCHLPFVSQYFDRVLCVDVMEHIENDLEACSELSRILKQLGVVVIHVPYSNPRMHYFIRGSDKEFEFKRACMRKSFDHVRDGYTLSSLSRLLEQNKLQIIFWKKTFGAFGIFAWWIGYKTRKISSAVFPILYAIARCDSCLSQGDSGLIVCARKIGD